MSGSADSINQIELLINKRRYWRARKLALRMSTNLSRNNPEISDANFWFVYGLAVRLTRRDKGILRNIRARMFECKNYNPVMDGDWLRNDILENVRNGNLDDAERLLPKLRRLHAGDENCLAAATMVEGRIAYSSHKFTAALKLFKRADEQWKNLGTTSRNQMFMANKLFLLKAMVKRNEKEIWRRLVAQEIMESDRSHIRRCQAWIIIKCRRGNAIDDKLMRKFA